MRSIVREIYELNAKNSQPYLESAEECVRVLLQRLAFGGSTE